MQEFGHIERKIESPPGRHTSSSGVVAGGRFLPSDGSEFGEFNYHLQQISRKPKLAAFSAYVTPGSVVLAEPLIGAVFLKLIIDGRSSRVATSARLVRTHGK